MNAPNEKYLQLSSLKQFSDELKRQQKYFDNRKGRWMWFQCGGKWVRVCLN